ncbi:hypothetical protein MPL3356_110133 [Mesorhizobium plurifarium]|uniref:Uncharacterized protein n=1 Tax=Mesorhizobium plurifarium TaxID=69974 RepID=A0A090DEA3_MESPL|nr:hypothetical protein MPL3356_110133 [Mesorhizobium plurifarium]
MPGRFSDGSRIHIVLPRAALAVGSRIYSGRISTTVVALSAAPSGRRPQVRQGSRKDLVAAGLRERIWASVQSPALPPCGPLMPGQSFA